ncbi:MAG TPA: carboxypeptidase regulatory-like domain-containing protein [Longimicrobiales bacterium]
MRGSTPSRAVRPLPLEVLCALVAALSLATVSAAPAGAQTVVGRAVVAGGDEPAAGAVVVAFDTAFERRAQALVDTAGAFALRLPEPGRYRLQAGFGGNFGPLSEALEVGAGAEVRDVVLEIPSPLAALAATCPAEAQGEGRAAVVGVVYASGSGVPLPLAWVTLLWDSAAVPAGMAYGQVARTDAAGRYRACGVPVGVPVTASVEALGSGRGSLAFSVPAAPWARADLEVEMGLGRSSLTVMERRPQPELGERSALSGRVVDAQSGAPVAGAVMQAGERTELTDDAGGFRFEGLEAGRSVVTLEHISYGTHREAVDLEAGVESVVRFTLAPRPIALDEIEVEGRRRRATMQLGNMLSTETGYVITGKAIDDARQRGTTVITLVRRFPGLSITPVRSSSGSIIGYCIRSTRRIMSILGGDVCMPVVIDGVPISGGVEYLRSLRVDNIESIEYVRGMDAAIRYGLEASAAGGALVLWTRGRGPHFQP